MAKGFEYQRLPGKLVGVVRKASLWEGKDHLLSISGTRFVENYRRFFYRDIEAIMVRRCVRFGSLGAWLSILFPIAVLLVSMYKLLLTFPAAILLSILVAIALYRLVVSLRFSCRCFVQTAVSREELPSLMRTWNVQPALDRIRSHIGEAQGVLPDDFRAPDAPDANETLVPVDLPEAAQAYREPGGPAARFSLIVNLALAGFALCLVDAALSVYLFDRATPPVDSTLIKATNAVLTVLQGSIILIALLGVHRLRGLRSLRNLLVAALCFTGLEIYAGNFLSSLATTSNGVTAVRADMLTVWHWVLRADATVALLIGFGGIILILLNWENFRRGGLSTA